ncbi:hypothetical protein, partial [Paracoccus acridae]|uniref:hypothetical protein n=1 Tax=Paracoccus acridae TaxID=1795310 RepID=UPI001E4EF40A
SDNPAAPSPRMSPAATSLPGRVENAYLEHQARSCKHKFLPADNYFPVGVPMPSEQGFPANSGLNWSRDSLQDNGICPGMGRWRDGNRASPADAAHSESSSPRVI